jgi:hypothetical protein
MTAETETGHPGLNSWWTMMMIIILKKYLCTRCGVDVSGSRHGPVVGSCEHNSEPLGCLNAVGLSCKQQERLKWPASVWEHWTALHWKFTASGLVRAKGMLGRVVQGSSAAREPRHCQQPQVPWQLAICRSVRYKWMAVTMHTVIADVSKHVFN